MTTFALIHGGNGTGADWAPLAAELEARGHATVAPDMPCEDPKAGAREYAQVVVDALEGVDDDVIVVGHSLGGMTVPVVAAMRPVRRMVFLASRPPVPGTVFVEYLAQNTPAKIPGLAAQTLDEQGRHITPPEHKAHIGLDELSEDLAHTMWDRQRPQGTTPFTEMCPLDAWPPVPSTVIVMTTDRAIDPDYLRREAARLGTVPIELTGGHWRHAAAPAESAEILSKLADA